MLLLLITISSSSVQASERKLAPQRIMTVCAREELLKAIRSGKTLKSIQEMQSQGELLKKIKRVTKDLAHQGEKEEESEGEATRMKCRDHRVQYLHNLAQQINTHVSHRMGQT